jgi:polyhydroxybutyrate depolymerase
MRSLVVVAVALCALPGRAQESALVVGGVTRHYELFVPTSAKPHAPLLVVMHGRGGSAHQVRTHSGFDVEAERLGVVVAYPDGIDHKWNDARQATLKTKKPAVGTDDVGFVLALVGDLAGRGLVDRDNVWVAGHSNGAFMALTLACVHAERFKGIAVVAGNLPKTDCNLARPVQAIFFHGTADPLIPYEGGGVGHNGRRGFIKSADETVQTFADAAHCDKPTRRAPVDNDPNDGTTLVVEDRAGCSAPIARVIAVGGGHGWPGRPSVLLLKGTQEIDATHAIASFFFEGRAP